MTSVARRLLVTGADGFVGGRLVTMLLANPAFATATLTLSDSALAARSMR